MFGLSFRKKNPPRQKQITAGPVRVPIRGKYDAAQTNADNRRHWANADCLSAGAANSASVRRILRNRARYEVANNSYAKGIVDTLANDVIGYGPTIEVNSVDPAANSRLKKAFETWAKEVKLAAKLRTMRRSKAVDGEAFAILTTNRQLKNPIKLDIRLIEADQVTDPDSSANHADGIRFDADGNPISYMILPDHPGSGMSSPSGKKTAATPAAAVIHWFSADRPGQVRGVPDIMPALPLFAQLRRYTLAVVAAAETAADFAAILYSTGPAADDAADIDPFLSMDIEQRMLTVMPNGWQMAQFKAEQPTTTYKEFKAELINEIARCLNMPFNIAACNSSGYNYSSGQLDHQTYFASIEVDQDDAELVIMNRIWMAWLEEAALVPGLLPAGPYGDWSGNAVYLWRSRGHADPSKMSKAQETKLANNTTTLADEWAKEGANWEEKLRQRARELALMKELGLSQPDPKSPTDPPNPEDADPEDMEDEDAEESSKAA